MSGAGGTDQAVADRAAEVVARRWPGARVADLHDLPGHSGLTLRADLVGGGSPARVCLKLCPPGRDPVGRHDVLRQADLLDELGRHSSVPVPAVLEVDRTAPPAVVFSWAEGVAAEPILEMEPGAVPAAVIGARFVAAAEVLAALHAVDPADLSVTAGVSPTDPRDELVRWQPTMATVDPSLSKGADELLAALMDHVPTPTPPRIVHGDYRLGNVLCHGTDVSAVVDWEIWSVGDRRVDLGWFRIMSVPDDLPGMAVAQSGVPDPEALLAAYEAAAGEPVGDLRWFDAAIRYKMAAIMGNNLKRHRTGARVDPYQERLVDAIPTLIDRATTLVGRLG